MISQAMCCVDLPRLEDSMHHDGGPTVDPGWTRVGPGLDPGWTRVSQFPVPAVPDIRGIGQAYGWWLTTYIYIYISHLANILWWVLLCFMLFYMVWKVVYIYIYVFIYIYLYLYIYMCLYVCMLALNRLRTGMHIQSKKWPTTRADCRGFWTCVVDWNWFKSHSAIIWIPINRPFFH